MNQRKKENESQQMWKAQAENHKNSVLLFRKSSAQVGTQNRLPSCSVLGSFRTRASLRSLSLCLVSFPRPLEGLVIVPTPLATVLVCLHTVVSAGISESLKVSSPLFPLSNHSSSDNQDMYSQSITNFFHVNYWPSNLYGRVKGQWWTFTISYFTLIIFTSWSTGPKTMPDLF